MLRGLWDGAGEVGPLSLDALVRHRVTVLGPHELRRPICDGVTVRCARFVPNGAGAEG